jgi:hypothetical protein
MTEATPTVMRAAQRDAQRDPLLRRMSRRRRILILFLIGAAATIAVMLHAPVQQALDYHAFADTRAMFGVPNFWNVVSNLPFLVIGLLGIKELSGCPRGALPALHAAYFVFFAGVIFVALGSAYYHLAPANDSLTWDRLPMTTAFMAFVAIIIGEHIDPRIGARSLAPLVLLGAASVVYWRLTDDLRPYIVVQFLPLLLIPLVLLLFPSPFSSVRLLWAMLGSYALSKALELGDRFIFAFGGLMSGHALKHAVAALSMYLFLLAVRTRTATSV